MSHQALTVIFAIAFILNFAAFGMQRTTLLLSREASVSQELGALLLPKWFPLVWLVRVAKWATIGAIVFTWNWGVAVGLVIADFVLTAAVPIPHQAYLPGFRKRAAELAIEDPLVGGQLRELLDSTKIHST